MTKEQPIPDAWEATQKILVILAHPDDPEFFCGATLARWVRAGHEVHYCLLTCGDKGSSDPVKSSTEICQVRHAEQQAAAAIIGAKSIRFLDLPDGYLLPTVELRREVVRVIRQYRPDILVACDPSNLFPNTAYGINHPDHRYAGQVVLDAIFPAAGNPHYFPELLKDEGLEPYMPKEMWLSLAAQPNVTLDVTDTWEIKVRAILEHKSQVADPQTLIERMKSRRTEDSTEDNPRYEEKFRLVKWR